LTFYGSCCSLWAEFRPRLVFGITNRLRLRLLDLSTMDLLKISRTLLVVTALELLVLLVPALLAATNQQNQTVKAVIVSLVVRPPDVLFIIGLLSMLATYYLFYHWVLPYAREQFSDDLISLALAGFFALQNFFLFIDETLPYRFIFLSVPLLTAWYKNRRMWVRYRDTPFEAQIEDWFRKARWTAIWTLASACLFALLMNPSSRQLIFGRPFADSAPLGSYFDIAIPGLSYFVFFAISIRSFLRTYQGFRAKGPQYVSVLRGLDGPVGGQLPDPLGHDGPREHAGISPQENESFDIFLSHNSKDRPAVRELAEALHARGLRVWLDEWELVPGRPWQEALEEIIETTRSSAVLVGKDGLGPWQDAEISGCLAEFVNRKLPVIPVLLPDAPEAPKLPFFLKRFTWVDLRGGLTKEGIDRLQWGATGQRPDR
jgi:hypothetical protein